MAVLDGLGGPSYKTSVCDRVQYTGVSPPFSAFAIDGLAAYTIALRVTDDGSLSHLATTTIDILNVAPTAAILSPPVDSPEGTEISLTGTVTDPGLADTHTYDWAVTKDGNTYASGTTADFNLTPNDNGSYLNRRAARCGPRTAH